MPRRLAIGRALRFAVGVCAAGFALVGYLYLTLPDVRPLARTNPRTTAFMELRASEAVRAGRSPRAAHRWVAYSRISPHLKRAVLVAEDDAFFEHEGIDVEQIRRSLEVDLTSGRAVRGASTITQQLAKNLYLSPSRNPMRKLRELLIARRLEAELSKARIFEIYLNVIEWGDGIWGAEAAARAHFGSSAAALTREQAALLAGSIINPRVLSPSHPGTRLIRRQAMILARMGSVEPPVPSPAAPSSVEASQDVKSEEGNAPAASEEPAAELPVVDELPPDVSEAPSPVSR